MCYLQAVLLICLDITLLFNNIALPGRYAHSLYEVSMISNLTEQVINDFHNFIEFTKGSSKIIAPLPTEIIIKIINELAQKFNFCKIFLNFLHIVAKNRRLLMLTEIYNNFLNISDKQYGRQKVIVKTALLDIDKIFKLKVENLLKTLFDNDLLISYQRDDNILGGVLIETDNLRIDASISNKLLQLTNQLKENT